MKALLFLALAPGLVFGAGSPRAEIQKCYDAMAAAAKARNVAGYMKYLTADFVNTSGGGRRNRAEAERQLASVFGRALRIDSITFKIQKLSMKGQDAHVEVLARGRITAKDNAGKLRSAEFSERDREMWRKTAKGWRCYRSETIPGTTMQKEIKPKK